MKPIPSPASHEAISQLERAQRLLKKAEKIEKSEMGTQPGYDIKFDTKPQNIMFAAESGGQTRNAHYSTNQHLIDSEDVANKGATSESFNLESLGGKLNPHEGGGSDRQVLDGILSKAKDIVEKAVCEECGANQYTGCMYGIPNCDGLQGTGAPGSARPHDPSDPGRSMY